MKTVSTSSDSGLSERSLAVALVTLTRYLANRDPEIRPYLAASLEHARASDLSDDDVAALQLIIKAIGG